FALLTPDLSAIDAGSFGFNNMRAAGVRPLLVILAPTFGGPSLTHDAAFYSRRIWGPLGGGQSGDRSVLDYFANVSNGSLLVGRAGTRGPNWIPGGSGYPLRQAALQSAASFLDANFILYDRNRDNVITPDELLVLVITNLAIAQTGAHSIVVNNGRV